MPEANRLCPESRLLVRVALGLWLLAGAATVWEVLAMQWPDSPFHVGILSGPIGQLRGFAFGLGAALALAAWLWPQLYGPGLGRYALVLLVAGSSIHVAALLYAAMQGMIGVQILDPRADARWLVAARGLGHALSLAALVDAFVRALRRL
jgi:hypothetical protein